VKLCVFVCEKEREGVKDRERQIHQGGEGGILYVKGKKLSPNKCTTLHVKEKKKKNLTQQVFICDQVTTVKTEMLLYCHLVI